MLALVASASALMGCGQPDGAVAAEVCGYRCGADGACAAGFACYIDGRCHREGSPLDRGCTVDAGPEVAPSIVGTVPSDRASDVPTDITLSLMFSEPVKNVSESTFVLRRRGVFEPILAVVDYDDLERTARLRPLEPLAEATSYIATIEPIVIDSVGNAIAGLSWEFTTVPDVTPPTATIAAPTDGETNVGVDAKIVVAFSEPVTGLTTSSLIVTGPDGAAVTGSLGFITQTAVRFTPTVLAPNTPYTLTLLPAIVDFAGNPLAGAPRTSTFTTGADTVPPRIESTIPPPEVPIQPTGIVEVHFSESMRGLSPASVTLDRDGQLVPVTLTYRNGTKWIRVTPVAPLERSTTYRLQILPDLTDEAGNPVSPGVLGWTIQTVP